MVHPELTSNPVLSAFPVGSTVCDAGLLGWAYVVINCLPEDFSVFVSWLSFGLVDSVWSSGRGIPRDLRLQRIYVRSEHLPALAEKWREFGA